MSGAIAIVNIGQLITLAGPSRPRVGAELRELGLVSDAAMLIDGGRIAATGSYAEIKSQIPPHAVVIDAEGRCVTPGFVDAHTHLCFAGNRAAEFEQRIAGATYQEVAAAGGGIRRTVALTRAATEDQLLASTRQHRDWMLRSGTTTIEAKSGYGLDRATEMRMLQVLARVSCEGPAQIVPTLLAAHTVPPEFASHRDDYVRWIANELIPEVAQANLARYCDAFCDDHAFTVEETRRVLSTAKEHGLGLRLHAEQFRPGTGAELAAELGAATADHLETVTDETLHHLRTAAVQPVLLPGSVFSLVYTVPAGAPHGRSWSGGCSSRPTSIPARPPLLRCRLFSRFRVCKWVYRPPKRSPRPRSTQHTVSISAAMRDRSRRESKQTS